MDVECPECGGDGVVVDEDGEDDECLRCTGTGEIDDSELDGDD